MSVSLILGALSLVAAAGLLWWAITGGRASAARIELGNFAVNRPDLEAVARSRADTGDSPVSSTLASIGRRLSPSGWTESTDRRLLAAGSPAGWTTDRLLAIKGLAVILGVALSLLEFASKQTGAGLLVLFVTGIVYAYPDARLKSMIQAREDAVRVALAETIDQITIMVQAGLALDGAIARTARKSDGPLAAELTRVAHDVRAGIPRSQALLAMAERVELPELRQVVTAIAQADRLGVPIAQTLQIQAAELREKRRQYSEEKAMKLPVKIVFPTLLCIMPALFVVVLGPAAMRIFDTLGQ